DARTHNRHGPRVVRIVNAVTPATTQRRCDEEDTPARVVRDGRVGRGVSRRLEARLAVEVGRERDDGQARLLVLRDARTTAREALKRRLDCGPRLAPKRLVLVRAREHAFDFRQDEFVSMAFINVRAAREASRERRADALGQRVVSALYDYARAHATRARELREVAGLCGCDQLVSQTERALSGEHSPDGEHAVRIE